MPSPYSLDLRVRVLEALNSGMKMTAISEIFSVARKTVYNWQQKMDKNGTLEPKEGYQIGHSHKITDKHEFENFVNLNPSRTSQEIAEAWGDISSATVRRTLNKMGYTNKKNLSRTMKPMKICSKIS